MNYDSLPFMLSILAVNLVIATGLLLALRMLKGILANVDTTHELAEKDNAAFGIALAGGIIALTIMMTGAISGEASDTILQEVISVLLYGLMGLVALAAGRLINERLIFHRFSLKEQIHNKNMAAGIVEAANMIAMAIIIRAAMIWVETDGLDGLIPVALIFLASQLILLAVTRIRSQIYKKRHDGKRLQTALENGNAALAMRYLGNVVGAALAVNSAAGIVAYHASAIYISVATWLAVGSVLVAGLFILSLMVRKAVLNGIDVVEEVDDQNNMGVAAIEASIFIAVGFILSGLFG
jgi:uncharacterized membrane protein YjfL (UPF0719 family)